MLDALLQGLGQLTQPQVQAPSRSSWDMPLVNTNFGGAPQRDSITELMNQLYQPQMGMQNAYNQHINNYPEREAPSALRRIGAALYAMGPQRENPLASADQFLNYHYYQNLGDWNNKGKGLQQAADNERAQNINERQLAYQTAGRQLESDRLTESQRKADADLKFKQGREERLREQFDAKQELAQWMADNPVGVTKVGKDGFIYVVNPRTGAEIKTKVLSGELSDLEKDRLIRSRMYEGVAAREASERRLIDERADRGLQQYIDQAAVDNVNPLKTNPPRSSTRVPPDPNIAETRARNLREQEMKLQYPKYFDARGNLRPSGIFTGPSASERERVSSYILNGRTGIEPGNRTPFGGGSGASSPLTVAPPNSMPSGKVKVKSPDGRTGTIDASELSAATANGWVQVP